MFVVISPAKKLLETNVSAVSPIAPGMNSASFTFKGADIPSTKPLFIEEARQLNSYLSKFSVQDITKLMKLSPKLAELNHQRYKEMFRAREFAAMFMFQGDTYIGLQAATLSAAEVIRGQEQLRIISGLYGLVRPLDAINPHRLEMVTPLATASGKNLYEFWGTKLRDQIIGEMHDAGVSCLMNAASPAYARAVLADEKKFTQEGIEIIHPRFEDYNKGSYKVIGLFAKKARGAMAKYIIQQQPKCAGDITHFNLEGYEYDADASAPKFPVFRRRNYQAA